MNEAALRWHVEAKKWEFRAWMALAINGAMLVVLGIVIYQCK